MAENSIGFIGVGNMGYPMARNLLQAGFHLRVYDKDAAKSAPLVELGAQQVSRPDQAVDPGGIVVSVVPDDQALEEVVTGRGGILERIGTGGVHISMSTISPVLSKKLAALYAERGSSYIAATVSGRPNLAAVAQLSIFYAGPQVAKERVLPLLHVLGPPERSYDLGEQVEAANGLKIAFNYLIPVAIASMSAAMTLAEKYGVPRNTFLDILLKSPLFGGKVYSEYGAMVAADEYAPALFRVELGLKDVELMLSAAQQAGIDLPFAEIIRGYLLRALEEGWGAEDWAVLARVIAKEAGLD